MSIHDARDAAQSETRRVFETEDHLGDRLVDEISSDGEIMELSLAAQRIRYAQQERADRRAEYSRDLDGARQVVERMIEERAEEIRDGLESEHYPRAEGSA